MYATRRGPTFFFEKETTRVGKRLFGLPQLLYKFDLPPLVRKSFFLPIQLLKLSGLPFGAVLRVVLAVVALRQPSYMAQSQPRWR